MKKVMTIILLSACCFFSSRTSAQSCKPDVSSQDRITKKAMVQWEYNVNDMNILKSLLDDLDIYVRIGRYGDGNAVSVLVHNRAQRLAGPIESTVYRFAKGNRFSFGFSDGESMSFVSNNAANHSNMAGVTVVLAADIHNKDLLKFRESLTGKRIDAIRVELSGGTIERTVNEKNGEKMRAKFACFYQYLDDNKISLTADDEPQPASQPAKPETVPAAGSGAPAQAAPEPAAPGAPKMTNSDVIDLVKAGLSEQVVFNSIRQAAAKDFDLSAAGLIALKKAGVSDAIIVVMQEKSQQAQAPPAPPMQDQSASTPPQPSSPCADIDYLGVMLAVEGGGQMAGQNAYGGRVRNRASYVKEVEFEWVMNGQAQTGWFRIPAGEIINVNLGIGPAPPTDVKIISCR